MSTSKAKKAVAKKAVAKKAVAKKAVVKKVTSQLAPEATIAEAPEVKAEHDAFEATIAKSKTPAVKAPTQASIIDQLISDGLSKDEMATELADICRKDVKWAKARINLHLSYIRNGKGAGRKIKATAAKMSQPDLFA